MKKLIAAFLIIVSSFSCFAESDAAKYRDETWFDTLCWASSHVQISDGLIRFNNRELVWEGDIDGCPQQFFLALADLTCRRYEREIGSEINEAQVFAEMISEYTLYKMHVMPLHTDVTNIEVK